MQCSVVFTIYSLAATCFGRTTIFKRKNIYIGNWLTTDNKTVVGVTTINTRLQMVCTFIDKLSKYTTCIMRSLRRSSWCYWSAVGCDARATVGEVGWRRCCLENCRECACFSLGLARWGVLFSEARWSQRVDLAGSHLSLRRPAPITGYIRLPESTTRRPELHCWKCTCKLVRVILLTKSKSLYDWQSVSMSWYRVPMWDLRPDIISCRNVAVWNLRCCICGAPFLTRGRVCNLQCNHSMVWVAHNVIYVQSLTMGR
jgi:hypothetical protein